jgi:hypothetical protein
VLIRVFFSSVVLLLVTLPTWAQTTGQPDYGHLSGNFQTGSNYFIQDKKLGQLPPQYTKQLSSNESFLFLNYKIKDFDFNFRYDFFSNTNLLAPLSSYSNHGIGFWSIGKDIGKLNVTVGSFYDQIGTGLIFRAFEDRLIGIDYAIQGARVKYKFNDNFFIKAFVGNQKGFFNPSTLEDTRFTSSKQSISGINAEKGFNIGSNINLNLGAGATNRTLDDATMNQLVSEINSLPLEKRFIPKYNTYAYTGYASVSLFQKVNMYVEIANKSFEALRNNISQSIYGSSGYVYYGNVSYATKGFGLNVQGRKIDKFQFRSSPYDLLLNGIVTYLPALTRANTYRLLARYNPFAQELGEDGIQADFTATPFKHTTVTGNFSYVQSSQVFPGQTTKLFREMYIDVNHKFGKNFKMSLGFQTVYYNQAIYELNTQAPDVTTMTPFGEFNIKLTRKQSLRIEWQYLHTKQDQGSFANMLVEYNVAPKLSFALGDMINTDPVRTPGTPQELITKAKIHYYTVFVAYQEGRTRFVAEYKKQVAGVNCTGGICRVEPAFNGARIAITTSF